MIRRYCCVLFILFFGLTGLAYADDEEDITRSLTMTCDYSDYKTFQSESVSIVQTKEDIGKPAAVKKFKRGSAQPENEIFIVRPGQFAECIYPSGTRVRAKVGEGTARPYGECGGDPEVFMSLWVNEKKIISQLWFAGHCRERFGNNPYNPSVSFKISGIYNGVSVQKCHSASQQENNVVHGSDDAKKVTSEPLSVCVDFPDVSKYPQDSLEYPRKKTKLPKVGEIEIINGSTLVCQAVRDELKRDFDTFSKYPDEEKIKLSRPDWNETKVKLPERLKGCRESIFDFNNDGKMDRVFRRSFENTYMDGSVLLIQPGRSSTKLIVSASPIHKNSIFLPFQLDKVCQNIYDCSPFSQKNDGAGFSMKGRNEKEEVYFRGRYSSVSPFSFKGVNFIGVSTTDEKTKDFVAVLKPLPDGTFQKICLLRRVSENF